MPDDHLRVYAVARQFRGQPHLYEKVRRLSDRGAGHPGVGLVSRSSSITDQPERSAKRPVNLGRGPRKRAARVEQVSAHPPPLRAHPAEHENRRGAVADRPAARHGAVDHRSEPGEQVVAVAERYGQPVVVVRPSRPHGVHQRNRVHRRVGDEREQLRAS